MKQPWFFIALMISCLLCSPTFVCAQERDVLRILSYNIHHGEGMDGELNLERIAQVIQSVSPDIVALQEVDKHVDRSENVDQAKELARLLHMNVVFARSIDLGDGQYGNAVLTKWPVKNSEIIPLPGREKRSALCVTLNVSASGSAEEIIFIATHFDRVKNQRIKSVPLVNQWVDNKKDVPVILAGDLNATPGSATMNLLEAQWTNATRQEGFLTYPADKPKVQIDHILYPKTQSHDVLEIRVLEEDVASDHRPILAVLQLHTSANRTE